MGSPGRKIAFHALVATTAVAALAVPVFSVAATQAPVSVHVGHVVDVARHSPYAGRECNVATPYYTSPGGKEGEPAIAVNPTRPRNRIVAWMDATRATVNIAYTKNRGRTWSHSAPRGIDDCTGNHARAWEASGDPWVSVGPDGTAYLSTLTWAHFATPPYRRYVSAVHVQVSHDGGATWSKPDFLAGHRSVADKPMVVADPRHAGVAYEIWRNQSFGLPVGDRGKTRLYFAATHDAGKTWTDPITIARGARSDFFGTPEVSVLRDGTLIATSSLARPSGATRLLSWRSHDGGHNWQGPNRVAIAPAGQSAPLCGQSVAGGDTTSPSGQQVTVNGHTVAFVWLNGKAAAQGSGKIMLSRTHDDGRSWHTHAIVRSHVPVILASIAADSNGHLGIVWDAIREQAVDCSSGIIPVQALFATSATGRRTWSTPETIGPRSWNLASGLRGSGGFSGYFVGDYQSIAPTPAGFTSVTVQGPPIGGAAKAPKIAGANGVMVGSIRIR